MLSMESQITISRFHKPHSTSILSLPSSPSHSLFSLKPSSHFLSLVPYSSLNVKSFSKRDSFKVEAVEIDHEKKIKRKKLAVFVSGGGSNLKAVHLAAIRGLVNGEIVVLVSSKADCGGVEYARNNNIPVIVFPKTKQISDSLSVESLVAALRKYEVDFILLAGYLKLIPDELVKAFPKSILNIHPSLLPAFGGKGFFGMKVHQAVISSGARYSGPTIHFVDEHYDTGRILAQRVVPVHVADTAADLAAKVLQKEHELYVEVAEALCDDRIVWRKDGVPLIQSKENPNNFS